MNTLLTLKVTSSGEVDGNVMHVREVKDMPNGSSKVLKEMVNDNECIYKVTRNEDGILDFRKDGCCIIL
ncbi:hypothetical protein JQC92_21945 [Shewanella sp. 202IG2-18]|uniref:hypothetical protein n=1 Tax=Parashewanella hymeniacidonis TaxID=2807618 RepID=UPI001961D167|nr:hypothetical protein [Parashewanella hymeniacidonis]MBM7074639.1 hypothetical protein [Parashewanella hymeniacidonis]